MKRIEISCFNDVNGKALTEIYYGYTKEEALEDMRSKIGRTAYIVSCVESEA